MGIEDSVITTWIASCDGPDCPWLLDDDIQDREDLILALADEGWHVDGDTCYCPEHAPAKEAKP